MGYSSVASSLAYSGGNGVVVITYTSTSPAVTDIGDPYPGRQDIIQYYDSLNPAFQTPGLKSWGGDNYGQLGTSSTGNMSIPSSVGTSNWRLASAGGLHSTALKTDGTLWSWGNNAYGQLGNGDATLTSQSSPVQVSVTNMTQFESGFAHTAGVDNQGYAWAWGNNAYGQLGDGTTTNRSSPVQCGTLGGSFYGLVISISAGGYHTMGVTNAGQLWGWGLNTSGQLGTGGTNSVSTPTQIGVLGGIWSQVSCGWLHTLALDTTGRLFAWGDNTYGQLGLGDTVPRSSPVQVGSATNWSRISAKGSSSGGILTDNSLLCWGYNGNGQLGLGDLVNRSSPTQLGSLKIWQNISMGLYNTAAISTDGRLLTWGYNQNGELGQGTSGSGSYSVTPVMVGTLTNWKSVSVGGNPVDIVTPNVAAQGFTLSIVSATDF